MAARFPVSATSVAYQIKAAWASKIHVIYWPAGADSLHRLRAGETATTIITRSTSGATYNSTEGRIEGNSSVYFTDSISGGYGGLREQDDYSVGVSLFGDLFNGIGSAINAIGSVAPPDSFNDGLKLRAVNYTMDWGTKGSSGRNVVGLSTNTAHLFGTAMRHYASDPTARIRTWTDGTEGSSSSYTVSGTALIGDTARPLYLGGTKEGTGSTKLHFESAWFGAGSLSDADMVALTNDPSTIIEAYAVPSDLSGTATLAGITASGSMAPQPDSSLSGAAALGGITASGDLGVAPGVITTPVLKNNTGTVLASVSNVVANVYNATTGALVVRKTGLSSDGSGVVVITDAALMPGTAYAYEIDLSAASLGRRLPLGTAA